VHFTLLFITAKKYKRKELRDERAMGVSVDFETYGLLATASLLNSRDLLIIHMMSS
jgi:hypothetical protein